MLRKKIIKRCPKGHEMNLDWRRCPRCTGRSSIHEGRDITEATVVLGPHAAPADETRIVSPGLSSVSRSRADRGPDGSPSPFSSAPPAAAAPPPSAFPGPSASSAPPPPPAVARLRLECTAGPLAGRSFTLEVGVYRVGKGPPPGAGHQVIAVPADRFMSKDHAVITVGTVQVVLSDPGSTNGSFVNGERIARAILAEGDEIRLGESFFRLDRG